MTDRERLLYERAKLQLEREIATGEAMPLPIEHRRLAARIRMGLSSILDGTDQHYLVLIDLPKQERVLFITDARSSDEVLARINQALAGEIVGFSGYTP